MLRDAPLVLLFAMNFFCAVTRVDDMLEVTTHSVSGGSAGRAECSPVVLRDDMSKRVLDETMGQKVETQNNLDASVLLEGLKLRRKFNNPACRGHLEVRSRAILWQVLWLTRLRKDLQRKIRKSKLNSSWSSTSSRCTIRW